MAIIYTNKAVSEKIIACKCQVKGEGAGGNCMTNGECVFWNARSSHVTDGTDPRYIGKKV